MDEIQQIFPDAKRKGKLISATNSGSVAASTSIKHFKVIASTESRIRNARENLNIEFVKDTEPSQDLYSEWYWVYVDGEKKDLYGIDSDSLTGKSVVRVWNGYDYVIEKSCNNLASAKRYLQETYNKLYGGDL